MEQTLLTFVTSLLFGTDPVTSFQQEQGKVLLRDDCISITLSSLSTSVQKRSWCWWSKQRSDKQSRWWNLTYPGTSTSKHRDLKQDMCWLGIGFMCQKHSRENRASRKKQTKPNPFPWMFGICMAPVKFTSSHKTSEKEISVAEWIWRIAHFLHFCNLFH